MMEKNNVLKKMLVVGTLIFLISTSCTQGKTDDLQKELPNIPLAYEGYLPYLKVELADGTQSFTPTDDTYIANLDPSEVNGDLTYLATRNRYGGGSEVWECDILIKFDLSSIPPSTPIISASLNLYYYAWGDSNPAGRPLTAYKITSDWHELTVNYNTQPSKASLISDTQTVPGSVDVWISWELTEDVQQYIDDPASNFGWEIMDETYWGWYDVPVAYFYPKEYESPPPSNEFIPYLEVVLADETRTFNPTDDTYIANLDPSEVNGDLTYLATRNRYGGGSDVWECDILIKFDLSSIPPSTPIISASLNLYYYAWGDSNPAGRPLTVYRITSDWDEMTVNYNTRPSKSSNVSATQKVPSAHGVGMSWELTEDVQQYIDDPASNFGWEIMDETYWGWYDVPVAYFKPKTGDSKNNNFITPLMKEHSQETTGHFYRFYSNLKNTGDYRSSLIFTLIERLLERFPYFSPILRQPFV
ncbi:MAG: DNRLRE domain-containing protein [Candidatus Thermoplasmatota archaeon]